MKFRQLASVMAIVSVSFFTANAQIVSINSPVPWVTQRNDSITVRAQIDTSQLKKKEIVLSVVIVENGKKKVVTSKKCKIVDYTSEFALGILKTDLLGGQSYANVDWSLPGTENKGSIGPIGIVAESRLSGQSNIVSVAKAKDDADAQTIAALVTDENFQVIGDTKFAGVWNKKGFHIVLKKQGAPGTLRFSFDGKNGKNAFLSFADRTVMYSMDKDSLWGVQFQRQLSLDNLTYSEKTWSQEITKSMVGDKVVILIPWYDIGIIPVDDRRFGFGVTAFNEKNEQTVAFPPAARFFVPGTWGDLQLAK